MKHFFRLFAIFLIAIMGTCCVADVPARVVTTPPQKVLTTAERLQEATVALVATKETEKGLRVAAFCSGVWVSNTEILTAAHCVEPEVNEIAEMLGLTEMMEDPIGTPQNFLIQEDLLNHELDELTVNKVREAVVVSFNREHDLALLKVKFMYDVPADHGIASLYRGDIHNGDAVHVVGHTLGLWWTYTRGYVANNRNMKGPHKKPMQVLQISAPVWGGNSGGGVYNELGELLGIASFISPGGPNLSFFVHRDIIRLFLTKNNIVAL